MLAALFHIAWIDRPFSAIEPNPGLFFGPYVMNWEQLGFANLGGLPMGWCQIDNVSDGEPYLRHPPGLSWMFYLVGPGEWRFRAITIVFACLGAALLYRILVRPLGEVPALTAGAVFLLAPNVAAYSLASYENCIIALGLAVLLVLRYPRDGSSPAARWGGKLILTSALFFGVWIDWTIAFFCLAGAVVASRKSMASTLRRLMFPACIGLVSLLSVLIWRSYVSESLVADEKTKTLGGLFDQFVLMRPSWTGLWHRYSRDIPRCFTWPLIVGTVAGTLPLWRADRRLTVALWLVAVLPLLAFATHDDRVFYTFSVPIIAASCAALLAVGHNVLRARGTALAGVLLVAWTAWASWDLTSRSATTFFRDVGHVASEFTRDSSGREFLVSHNLTHLYGYYVTSPNVQHYGVRRPVGLRAASQAIQDVGLKFMWIRSKQIPSPALAAFLAPFPKQEIPQLIRTVDLSGHGDLFEITEAWMVTIREPL